MTEHAPGPAPGRVSVLTPLHERGFRLFFIARVVNLAGTSMASVALAFAVLSVDSSAGALGLVLAARSIPLVAFLLLGGVIADRFGRTLVVQGSYVLAGLTQLAIAVLVITGVATIGELVALSAVNGLASALNQPALNGVVPALVPRALLQQANVVLGLARSSLTVIGPALAGVLVVSVGAGWALAVDGTTYLLAAGLLLGVRLPARERGPDGPSMVGELVEGWRYVCTTTWLWVIVLGFTGLNALFAGGFETLGPVIAQHSAIGEHGWGLVVSAEAVGYLVMGLVLSRVQIGRPLWWGMLGMVPFGLPMIVLGLSRTTVVVALAALVAGAGVELFSVGWSLALMEQVPDEMLSRANSYDSLGSFAAIPIGQLAIGPLGTAFGLERVTLLCGVGCVVLTGLVLLSRSVRQLPRVSITA